MKEKKIQATPLAWQDPAGTQLMTLAGQAMYIIGSPFACRYHSTLQGSGLHPPSL